MLLGGLTEEKIATIIRDFYNLAAQDMIIGHFFFNHDLEHIIAQQTRFAIGLLGGKANYRGKSMEAAHRGLKIRLPHFGRRQVLMQQVMIQHDLPAEVWKEWLKREDKLKSLILGH